MARALDRARVAAHAAGEAPTAPRQLVRWRRIPRMHVGGPRLHLRGQHHGGQHRRRFMDAFLMEWSQTNAAERAPSPE